MFKVIIKVLFKLLFRAIIKIFKKKRTWILLSFIIVAILIWAGYQVLWTDFQTQSLWDWMELLIIPVVLGAGALLFQRAERIRERETTRDKQRQDTLMTYFDVMENLLLKQDLLKPKKGSKVRTVARARTLFVFRNLDGLRKRYALQFLYESDLIKNKNPIVELEEANLEGADLGGPS